MSRRRTACHLGRLARVCEHRYPILCVERKRNMFFPVHPGTAIDIHLCATMIRFSRKTIPFKFLFARKQLRSMTLSSCSIASPYSNRLKSPISTVNCKAIEKFQELVYRHFVSLCTICHFRNKRVDGPPNPESESSNMPYMYSFYSLY